MSKFRNCLARRKGEMGALRKQKQGPRGLDILGIQYNFKNVKT